MIQYKKFMTSNENDLDLYSQLFIVKRIYMVKYFV